MQEEARPKVHAYEWNVKKTQFIQNEEIDGSQREQQGKRAKWCEEKLPSVLTEVKSSVKLLELRYLPIYLPMVHYSCVKLVSKR